MTTFEALVLGAVQGLFMFVPVSSTSHLALVQTWLRARGSDLPPPESPDLVLFDLVVHVATLVSVAVVMRESLAALVREVARDVRSGRLVTALRAGPRAGLRRAPASRLVVLGLLSTAVTGVVGLLVRERVEVVFATPALIAGALALTGLLLWVSDTMVPGRRLGGLRFGWRGPRSLTVGVAVAVGLAQAAALTPGLSRSGTTIVVALLLGMDRTLAARYSFFVAIPTILAATAVQGAEVHAAGGTDLALTPVVVAFVTAAVVGAVALWAVLRLLYAARFRVFSGYVWLLAALVLVLGVGAPVPVEV